MWFSKKKQAAVYGVMDVGADAIKGVVFEMPREEAGGRAASAALPRVLKKFVWDLPMSCSPLRKIKKIKESVFIIAENIGKAPDKITVALGPEVGECVLQDWVLPVAGDVPLTGKNVRAAYRDLFNQRADARRAMIAVPVEVLVNGYPWAGQEQASRGRITGAPHGYEIRFRVMTLSLSVDSGVFFAEVQRGLVGIATEFIPLVVAEREALGEALGIRDAFLIDIGAEVTALVSVRDGRLAHVAFMPVGIRCIAGIAAKKYRYSLRDARGMMRRYAAGGMRDDASMPVSAAASEGVAEWKKNFVRALDAFYPTGPLSPAVLLAGGGAHYPEIKAAVASGDWLGGFSYAEKPVLRVLEGAAFFNGDTLGGNMRGPEDAGLAALMAYVAHRRPIF